MPYTVSSSFEWFRENVVDLTVDQTARAKESRNYLYDQLRNLPNNDSSFPRLTGEIKPFGSFARHTKIRPLDDIDLLLILNGFNISLRPAPYQNSYTYYVYPTNSYINTPLSGFLDDNGCVNSTRILNKIRNSLYKIPNYSKAEIHRNWEAVTMKLSSYSWNFDIVPAIGVVVESYYYSNSITYYLIPDGAGHWKRTDPRKDQKRITEINSRHNGFVIPMIRLLKYWNKTNSIGFSSYYFETLVSQVFRDANFTITSATFSAAIMHFFCHCPYYINVPCRDPKELGPNLDADIPYEWKQATIELMENTAQCALYACQMEVDGEQPQAIGLWQEIFGMEFPSYGN